MREIHVDQIISAVERLCIDANVKLPEDVKAALNRALEKETSPLGKEILSDIIKNYQIAEEKDLAICQDTGFAVFFVKLGQDVRIVGGNFSDAINEGVRRGYKNGYLRKSIVDDPLIYRKNTGDNTPAIIHLEMVPGDKIHITFAPKGGGSENMSALRMLKPADGVEGVKKFVLETVRQAGPNPCPPIVVGVGIGGTIEVATLIAKKALLRPIGEHHPMPEIAKLEKELLEEVNKLGIGPQGFGGKTTALAVNIETFPAHIASLPVAINIQCHVARHMEIEI
ncbi:L(+)-tartrate dehydratase subunit alpha [Fervidicola ferrireducens]|uniref:L(+)-tartrate dehydratase subunit alpha n=1 Tax=Fervidicola ferrireducens TaxID=520764 RepID=A0A140LE05_9FIRM|nr:fumarate hydratase [Fervidicola ferrireducens]KXG78780.1 L(+)-tartrate dehydratase subunit alpha [Fervidicola ferrireducens]